MDRRRFLGRSALGTVLLAEPWTRSLVAQTLGSDGRLPAPIAEPHFPDRVHLFIWRNWELANVDRLARVLGTSPERVLEIGYSMGLPKKPILTEEQLRRIYVTVIRQNWHILPDEQLIQLLGWDREGFEFHLREDDFLWIKLGSLKPRCERLTYVPPSREARVRAREINGLVRATFGPALDAPGEPAFQFIEELTSTKQAPIVNSGRIAGEGEVDLRDGWVLLEPPSESAIPLGLVRDFQDYLRDATGAALSLREPAMVGAKTIRFSLDPAASAPLGSFEVSVHQDEINVSGHDVIGLRQAVYFLQRQMEQREGPFLLQGSVHRTARVNPCFAYSYFALYGDPLMEAGIDPFPDGFLRRMARVGVKGVWLQAILRNLAPSAQFPEFGVGWETRLRTLRGLVERAGRYGLKVFLYINEPRAMPAAFFVRHPKPDIKGAYTHGDADHFAMCTSTPTVREWVSDALAHVFSQVPSLGGLFCITASENLTNCCSHGQSHLCPRCSKREGAEVVAELIATIRDGVHRGNDQAEVIAYDWGWGPDWVSNFPDAADLIRRLPKDVMLLSVSEWAKPITRGGHSTKVGEYSMSAIGPGPRATRNWEMAAQRGLSTVAKVQWGNTWEISAVPYIPVPNLVVEHCQNLLKAGVQGLMLSWTLGGYPSPNFEAAEAYYFSPMPEVGEALLQVAERRYGREAAGGVREAWDAFSKAFQEFPMEGGGVVYTVPTQHGPANPLRLRPTGYKAGMVLFPYDDYKAWVGDYPVEIAEGQFEKMATMWEAGLDKFRQALTKVPKNKLAVAQRDLGIAETCGLHFRSVANQMRFYRLREELLSADPGHRGSVAARMKKIAEWEIDLAKRQYFLARQDSTIAYEASNHYYYRPLDLVEKVINCQHTISLLEESFAKS